MLVILLFGVMIYKLEIIRLLTCFYFCLFLFVVLNLVFFVIKRYDK